MALGLVELIFLVIIVFVLLDAHGTKLTIHLTVSFILAIAPAVAFAPGVVAVTSPSVIPAVALTVAAAPAVLWTSAAAVAPLSWSTTVVFFLTLQLFGLLALAAGISALALVPEFFHELADAPAGRRRFTQHRSLAQNLSKSFLHF